MAAVSAEKKELFESVPVPKALMTMAIPTIITQLIALVYNIVDAFFIGRVGNPYMTAATTLSLTLVMLTIPQHALFGTGAGSLVARLNGSGRSDEAKSVSAFGLYGALCVSALFSALIGVFLTPLLYFLGASPETIGFARQYVFIVCVLGTVPCVLSNAMAHLLRNVGYSKQASLGLSSGAILNIILDPLFMFVILPDGYEVVGAALATLIGNVVACCYLLYQYVKASGETSLCCDPRAARLITKPNVKQVFNVGVPASMMPLLYDMANVFLNMIAASHGDLILAGMGIAMKVERLPVSVNLGLSQAMMPIVSYNYSSGNRERMHETIKTARLWGLCVAVGSVVLYFMFAPSLAQLFMSTGADPDIALVTIAYAAAFLKLRCLAAPVHFINFHSSFCMQAMGDGKGTAAHAFIRIVCFYIPFMFILNALFDSYGLALSLAVSESCTAVVALWLLRRSFNRQKAQ